MPAPKSLPPRVATSQDDMRLCLSCRRPAEVTTIASYMSEQEVMISKQQLARLQQACRLLIESVVQCGLLASSCVGRAGQA